MAGPTPAGIVTIAKMLLASVVVCLILTAQGSRATALTTYLQGNEKSCFYADVDGT